MRPIAPESVPPTSQPSPGRRPAATTRHNHSSTRSHDSARAPRYTINHFDTTGMPVSLWGMDRRDVWRTAFCFHVRTVTIFIGVWYLMMYILALSFHAALLMYEPGSEVGVARDQAILRRAEDNVLPTPVSNIQLPKAIPLTIDHRTLDIHRNNNPRDAMRNGPLTLVLDTSRKATSQVILLTVCNMLITLLMVYGAVRGKPSYLMPFFVLRVFDFCIFCLTMVGYFSYLPNVTENLMNIQGMPFRDEILRMDPQLLSFITLIFIVAFIAVKAYIIGVIWNCYKYLMLRNTVIRGVIAYRHDDPTSIMGLQQTLLPDLPDYETAVNDPRYAKKPPCENSIGNPNSTIISTTPQGQMIAMPPPPPYSAVVATDPVHLVIPMNNNNNNNTQVPQNTPTEQTPKATPLDDVIIEPTQTSAPIFVPVQPQVVNVESPASSSPNADVPVPTAPAHGHQQ